MSSRVGILALEVYFPSTFVTQEDLEIANHVSSGKYTIGLGQSEMAFTGDIEDINSIALSVVKSMMEKYLIDPNEIGRLEVGTESLVDKSKSTKTVLMSLFAESGNTDIEGATVVNACYGGTAALLNALAWVDSTVWDGRYAIVVAADIAVYADGPARPTGGCGSVAMLIGRNAPLQIDLRTRSTHASHVWDFFKPNMDSEYPEVNGALSQTCYLRALDDCYKNFLKKTKNLNGTVLDVTATDYFLFHSPYNKLVQKSFGRLIYQDMMNGRMDSSSITKWLSIPPEETYEDKELETTLKGVTAGMYKTKVATGCEISRRIGNTYTASVYMNLSNLVSALGDELLNKKVILFSYGSGALATMLSINPTTDSIDSKRFSLQIMQQNLNIAFRLGQREKLSPSDLNLALESREKSHGYVPFTPAFSSVKLFPGTYFLTGINTKYERFYHRKPLDEPMVLGSSCLLITHEVSNDANTIGHSTGDDENVGADILESEPIIETKGFIAPAVKSTSKLSYDLTEISKEREVRKSSKNKVTSNLARNATYVWASGRPTVKVVVTGVAAALPGRTGKVFEPGVDNIKRILDGESFISELPNTVKDSMLGKNVYEYIKSADGSTSKALISTYDKQINVCASIGDFSLTSYGVAESIVNTMDRAVQVAVAAGLEALKDAGIVTGTGEGLSGWTLPESMQNSTGIVYATSFPALDAAIAEVSNFFHSKIEAEHRLSTLMETLRKRLESAWGAQELSQDVDDALKQLTKIVTELELKDPSVSQPYEFDRKFLFRVLVLGNAQLAQIIKARGPNMQTNAACAGATQAIALAYDMIQVGRAERMIVIAGDSASSDNLMPWLGNGFRSLGAATTCAKLAEASIPFNAKRSGMILGSGGIGMILESEEGACRRVGSVTSKPPFRCRLLGTLLSNSAYHGASMDRIHIAQEMERFISYIENELQISRSDICKHGVYFSHETSTHASASQSCAANEIYGLRKTFGEDLKHLLILNTKGFTGHPMGVSFEDVVAAEVLTRGVVPPIANFTGSDPALGSDLNFSHGGSYPCKYALRFAAGFGSQIALALYGTADP